MYKAYHIVTGDEYYFYNRPRLEDLSKILRKMGYVTQKNKVICDYAGNYLIREEFEITRLKVIYNYPED